MALGSVMVFVCLSAATFHSGLCDFSKMNKIVPHSIIEKGLLSSFFNSHSHSLRFIERMKLMKEDQLKTQLPTESPYFCHGLVCPKFTNLTDEAKEGYEVREYPVTRWFSTSLDGVDLETAEKKMFMKLFEYIDKGNKEKLKIAMTAPVLIKLIPGQGPTCASNFTMSFFTDPKQTNPPGPDNPEVFFSKIRKEKVYVASFKGYANEKKWLKCAESLGAALKRDGIKYVKNYFYTAGYDSPFRVFDRHNEVWFVAPKAKEDIFP